MPLRRTWTRLLPRLRSGAVRRFFLEQKSYKRAPPRFRTRFWKVFWSLNLPILSEPQWYRRSTSATGTMPGRRLGKSRTDVASRGADHPPALCSRELLCPVLGGHHREADMRCQAFFPNRGEQARISWKVIGHAGSNQHVGIHIAVGSIAIGSGTRHDTRSDVQRASPMTVLRARRQAENMPTHRER